MSCNIIPDIEACSRRDYSKEDLNLFIKMNRLRLGKSNIKSLRYLSKMYGFNLNTVSVDINSREKIAYTAIFEFGHSEARGTFTLKY